MADQEQTVPASPESSASPDQTSPVPPGGDTTESSAALPPAGDSSPITPEPEPAPETAVPADPAAETADGAPSLPAAETAAGEQGPQAGPETSAAPDDQQAGSEPRAAAGQAAAERETSPRPDPESGQPVPAPLPWYRSGPFLSSLILFLLLLPAFGWLVYSQWENARLDFARQESRLADLRARNDARESYLNRLRQLLQEDPCAIERGLAGIVPPEGEALPVLPGHAGQQPDAGEPPAPAAQPEPPAPGPAREAGPAPEKPGAAPAAPPQSGEKPGDAGTIPATAPEAAPEAPPQFGETPGESGKPPAAEPRSALPSPAQTAALLEQATVFIAAVQDSNVQFGSGFFVAPDAIVTATHLLRNARRIYFTNRRVGHVNTAKIFRQAPENGADLTLLRTEKPLPVTPLPIQTSLAGRGEDVVAWGYPTMLTASDPKFQSLIQGNADAAPEVVATEGYVNVVLADKNPPVVVHSATLSKGSGGGPLITRAGSVAGVNTHIRKGEESYRQSSLAVASTALVEFLSACGQPFTAADRGAAR